MSEQAVRREQSLWDSVMEKDWVRFGGSLHPDYVAVYPYGRRSAEEEIAATKSVEVRSASIEDVRVVTGQGMEAVSYRVAAKGCVAGRDSYVVKNVLSVWVRTDSGWKLICHSEVPAS